MFRTFSYNTKRNTVYNLVEETNPDDASIRHDINCQVCLGDTNQLPSNIVFL